jgi:hypothetical protein
MSRLKKIDETNELKIQETNWLELFLEFISYLTIDSKESGVGPLNLYGSQKRFLAEIIDGLDRDIHTFVNLKAMQLGISTISLAIDLFWLAVHPGMQGVLLTDTDGNRQKFRIILKRYIASLPRSYAIRIAKGGDNREHMVFENGSVLDFVTAGTRATSTEVGRSRAYNFCHATECANYGTIEGVVSLIDRLAEKHPHRLYIFESTAKGYNLFYKLWNQARSNPDTQKAFFIGWWAKEDYSIDEKSPMFAKYWDGDVDVEEQERVNHVWEKYGVRITPQQIAWYRWKCDVSAESSLIDQNFPWDEDDAFLNTGNSFFSSKRAVTLVNTLSENPPPFLGYAYQFANQFMDTKIESVVNAEDAMLKVYEEPSEIGWYAMGVDPAYGRSENKDRSVVQICRCYADRLVQVAEFATHDVENHQVAWVMAHLAGIYRNVMMIIEITGPGDATVLEVNHLKQLFDAGALPTPGNGEIKDIFGNARWFMYHRIDSPGAGYVYHWKCLSLDTPLPTPTGWTTMKEVQPGDKLLDDLGCPCTVTGVSGIWRNHECYAITFDDGSSITADADHLWLVHRHLKKSWGNGAEKLRKTSKLLDASTSAGHVIRIAKPLSLPEIDVPIHPYTLGVWLGDGYSGSAAYCASHKDIHEMESLLRQCGESLLPARDTGSVHTQTIRYLSGKLKASGLINNKHIPGQYLRASFSQRLALLQGLMDTDGSASSNGDRQCCFATSNKALAESFSELLRTLGFKAKYLSRTRTFIYKGVRKTSKIAHQFWFTVAPEYPVFRLSRKLKVTQNNRGKQRRPWHRIVSVKKIEPVPVRCVMVDSPSSLYLAGHGMIPTHNTSLDNKLSIMAELSDSFTTGMLEVRSIQAAMEMQSMVRRGYVIEPALDDQKDDRVFGLAFAHRAWSQWIRPTMIAENSSWERVSAIEKSRSEGDHTTMVSHIVSGFFQGKADDREEQEIQDAWASDD